MQNINRAIDRYVKAYSALVEDTFTMSPHLIQNRRAFFGKKGSIRFWLEEFVETDRRGVVSRGVKLMSEATSFNPYLVGTATHGLPCPPGMDPNHHTYIRAVNQTGNVRKSWKSK